MKPQGWLHVRLTESVSSRGAHQSSQLIKGLSLGYMALTAHLTSKTHGETAMSATLYPDKGEASKLDLESRLHRRSDPLSSTLSLTETSLAQLHCYERNVGCSVSKLCTHLLHLEWHLSLTLRESIAAWRSASSVDV